MNRVARWRVRKLFRWKFVRWVLLGAGVLLTGAQLVPVDRTNPPVETEVPAPDAVRAVLRRACYDCHSNETAWPWYSRVAPVSWLVAHDVEDGRKKVNYSTWNRYTDEQKAKKLARSWREVERGEMPMWIYTPTHPESRLSTEDKALLRDWATAAPR